MTALLRDFWYLAAPSRALKPGGLLGRKLLGEPVVIGRDASGAVFALRDICPHRGIPLRHGWVEGGDVVCCYHGWKFCAADGRCTAIPSLVPEQKLHLDRIRVPAFPCRETQGHVWVYVPRTLPREPIPAASLPPLPVVPGIGEAPPKVAMAMPFDCDIDHAAIGLMDPTHAAYVHTSWWWKRKPRNLRLKEKPYVPHGAGFRMQRYALGGGKGAIPYRLLGANVSTEITFVLPGIRVEHIKGDRHSVVAFTAITPEDETHCVVHQSLYWTMRGLGFATPLIRRFARTFLAQDRDVVIKQEEGLAYDPPLMLIDDADTQAKWYYRLKQEYLKAQAEGRPFVNPLEPKTLRYVS